MKGDTCAHIRDQAVTLYGAPTKNNGNGKKSNAGRYQGCRRRVGVRAAAGRHNL